MLVRSIHPDAAIRTGVDLVCLFLPTSSDWTAHLGSYALLSLLVVGALRGLISLVIQTYRTRQAVRRLLQFAQPPDSRLRARFASLRLDGRLDLIRAAAPPAFCYGFFRPRICVSTGLVSLLQAVEADRYACGQQGRTDALADARWVLVERSAALTREDTPNVGRRERRGAGGPPGAPARSTRPPRPAVATLLLSGALLGLLLGFEWILVQAGVTNVLWYLEHTPLGGC